MASVYRIKGEGGVVIESKTFLELPKAPTKITNGTAREGMIRYNSGWESFEGTLKFTDGSIAWRRFANLDENGRLLTSQLPDSITSGLIYTGSFDPLTDDIDPPFVYTALPMANSTNNGHYYIVRSILDQASIHLNTHPSTEPFVIFSPENPLATGNWLEIKYYIDNGIVSSAFARFIVENIPNVGHEGLLSLANSSPDLTKVFSTFNNPALEMGLSDSDWVIMAGTEVQRLRQSRVSILASAVSFDTNIMREVDRPFQSNSSNAQGILDNLIIYGLRRTGDSMTSDGGDGAGRLGIVYGSPTAPSIAFNDSSSDPDLNDGMHPDKWTDTSTGIFHPTMGNIGFSSTGTERLRITPLGIVVSQGAVNIANNAGIQLQGTGNTVANPGISAINDIMTFTIKGKEQVDFKDALSLFHGSVTVDDDLIVMGDEEIKGNSIVNLNSTVKGDTVLGTTPATNTLTVNAKSTFNESIDSYGNVDMKKSGTRLLLHAGTSLVFEAASSPTRLYTDPTKQTLVLSQSDPTGTAPGSFSFQLQGASSGAEITNITRFGVKLPILNPIDNSVGEDGMIAYSTQRNTVMQKTNGQWTTVSGGGIEVPFSTGDWVLNGSFYNYTLTTPNIQSIQVQEAVGGNFSPVEVDSIVISSTNAVLAIPSSTDLRFAGRLVVTYR